MLCLRHLPSVFLGDSGLTHDSVCVCQYRDDPGLNNTARWLHVFIKGNLKFVSKEYVFFICL